MKCPVCPDVMLAMTHRDGIEIDYCPTCRGVWLDRGELDKIIERAAGEPAPAPQPQGYLAPRPGPQYDDDRRRYEDQHRRYDEHYHKRKRKGLLGELFDFD